MYRATLTLADPPNRSVEIFPHNQSKAYGTKDIYPDKKGKIYLYFPVSKPMKTTVGVDRNGEKLYHGTVTSDGNGLLKMYGEKNFKKPEHEPYVGEDFTLSVDKENDNLMCPYLNFKNFSVRSDYRRMNGLIHISFRHKIGRAHV